MRAVACETLVTTGMALIAGEISTTAYADLPEIVRNTIKDIGYNSSDMGFDYNTCGRHLHHRQAVGRHRPGRRPPETRRTGRQATRA